MANTPISQLPNAQSISGVSAAAIIKLDQCRIGSVSPNDATFNAVSASAMFTTNITADTVITSAARATLVSAGTMFANAGRFSTVSASTPINVNSGGTGLSTVSAYSVICGGTTNTGSFQGVSTQGTAGQVLTSNGANALPTWQSGGSGALTLLSTQTASSSSSLNFDSSIITSTYSSYVFKFINLVVSNDAVYLRIRVSENNGSAIKSGASDYAYKHIYIAPSTGTLTATQVDTATEIRIAAGSNIGNASGEFFNGEIQLYSPSNSALPKSFIGRTSYRDASSLLTNGVIDGMYVGTNNAINYIQITPSAGTITSGQILCYGVT